MPQSKSPQPLTQRSWFDRLTAVVSRAAGLPATSAAAVLIILGWALCGPFFHYSDTWQLVINTGTTIITFLMVFLIQSTQNRDSCALHLKLDELIRAIDNAHNSLLNVEELGGEELAKIKGQYEKLASEARRELRSGEDAFEIFSKKGDGKTVRNSPQNPL